MISGTVWIYGKPPKEIAIMDNTRQVRCIFYTHVWSVHALQQAGLKLNNNELLAELATDSHLAPVFNKQAYKRFGLAGLLSFHNCLDKLGFNYKNIPAPLILAPNPSVTPEVMVSAVALLESTMSNATRITLLAHINDAGKFIQAFPYIHQFGILWDIADYPNLNLELLSQLLADNHCMSSNRWAGLFLCNHPWRTCPDAENRKNMLNTILGEYPLLQSVA
jgi:hypothetical protein